MTLSLRNMISLDKSEAGLWCVVYRAEPVNMIPVNCIYVNHWNPKNRSFLISMETDCKLQKQIDLQSQMTLRKCNLTQISPLQYKHLFGRLEVRINTKKCLLPVWKSYSFSDNFVERVKVFVYNFIKKLSYLL